MNFCSLIYTSPKSAAVGANSLGIKIANSFRNYLFILHDLKLSVQLIVAYPKILFICGGAFEGLEKIVHKESDSRPIGFGADIGTCSSNDTPDLSDVQPHDLVKFGLMPELIGRLPVITTLSPLSETDLLRILTEPKNALVKQYQELLSMDDVKLEFTDDALHRIAELAIKRKIGARGLRSIVEKSLQKVMFDVPDMTDAKRVVVTDNVIDGVEDVIVYGVKNKKIA